MITKEKKYEIFAYDYYLKRWTVSEKGLILRNYKDACILKKNIEDGFFHKNKLVIIKV